MATNDCWDVEDRKNYIQKLPEQKRLVNVQQYNAAAGADANTVAAADVGKPVHMDLPSSPIHMCEQICF